MGDSHGTHPQSQEHHHSHKKTYWMVFAALAVLTLIELYVAEMDIAYVMKASGVTFLALGKAFLVAYIFMHLNEETRWMKFIAAVPIFAVMYAVFIIVESVVR